MGFRVNQACYHVASTEARHEPEHIHRTACPVSLQGTFLLSEKFRLISEAYKTELEYGRTIEAYRSEVEFDGETFNADFLRVGRVSLAFVTSSGDKAGFWNKSTGRWEESSAAVKRSTIDGLKIALKQAPPTLITIPLTSYENSN